MASFPPHIKTIYEKVKQSAGVTTTPDEVTKGSIFFVQRAFKPNGKIKLLLWNIWRWGQLYAPFLLVIIGAIGKKTRWADRKFRNFDKKVIDGNAFAQEALDRGAVLAVIDNPRKHKKQGTFLSLKIVQIF